ncbi:hypothetical protein Tco_1293763 [Tanacetum coccineum]
MANENVPAPAPTRSDDQILPFAEWVPIGKSNFVLDLQKKQKNPIFQIFVDILQNTNFLEHSLLQPMFHLSTFNSFGIHSHMREALEITPIDQSHQFVSPPSGDAIMDFVNKLGYTEEIHFVSRMGIITSTHVDYAELMWEEFVQAIQAFLTDKANQGSPTKKGRKDKPHVIPYCQFTNLIICHLGRKHNLHQRSKSLLHLAEEDLCLGNFKFVPKGEKDEVFGMPIPNVLIMDSIRNAPCYEVYLGMVAKHDRKIAAKKEGKKKSISKADPSKKLVTVKQLKPKPVKEKSRKPAPAPKPKKIRKGKSSLQLIDKDESTQLEPEPEPEHQDEGEEYDVERAIQISLESFHAQGQAHVGSVAIQEPVAEATRPLPMVEGRGKAIATEEQATQSLLALHTPKRRSTMDQFIFQRRTPANEEASTGTSIQPQDDASANIVHDSLSHADDETGADTDKTNSGGDTKILQIGEEQGEGVDNQVNLEEKTTELDQGQAGSDPSKTPESRPPPEQVYMDEDQARPDPGESCVAFAGPNPEPMQDEFMANVYPNVHESLKFPADEHVILEDPISSFGTLSLMKNLDDAYNIGDQFLNDKSIEDEPGKLNVEAEVVSMVIVPIYQASSLVPPLTTPVIDLSPPKHVPSTTQAPIKSKTLDNTTQNLGYRVFTLELRDLPHKINETVCEAVKEVVHVALQAPLRDRFRELPEADMKEILHQRMFASGTYKSLPEHVALYEALDASMERANRDEFLIEKNKEAPSGSSKQKFVPHSKQPVEYVPIPDNVNVLDSEDTDTAHIPKIKTRPDWLKPVPEEDRPATPEPDWVIPPNEYEFIHQLVLQTDWKEETEKSRLRRPSFQGSLTISRQQHISSVPDGRVSLSAYRSTVLISLDQIKSEREYDIRAAYGISHWWFKRKEFYITRHSAPSDPSTVRSHMRILSVISLKTYERYGYTFLKEIVLRRADYNEYKISKIDFKNLHLNDFEDLYLLHLQGQLNHLSSADKVHLFNAVNLWIRNIVIRKRVEDLQLGIEISKPRAFNSGMEKEFGSKVDRRRSKEFMEVIERRLKIRRIFKSLESFVSGGLRDVDYSTDLKRNDFILLDAQNIRVIPKYHIEDGNLARANIKQALGRYEHVGPQDTRPQDGKRSQDDDQRLDLANDLKKA